MRRVFAFVAAIVTVLQAARANGLDFGLDDCAPNVVCLRPGDIDPTFGAPLRPYWGSTWLQIGTQSSLGAQDMALQADGRIVLVGAASDEPGTQYIVVARFFPNGLRDVSFGLEGTVHTNPGVPRAFGRGVAIQPDGKIVVAGDLGIGNFNRYDASILLRYETDGTLDQSFGDGGMVITPIALGSRGYEAVAVQPDGRIVAAGLLNAEFLLERFDPDGSPDPTFGAGGTVTTSLGGHHGFGAHALLLRPDGRILTAGATQSGRYIGCALAGFEANGAPDGTFGEGGAVRIENADDEVCQLESLALQADGRILAAGSHTSGRAIRKRYFRVFRFLPNGRLDLRFGRRGASDTVVYFPYLTSVTIIANAVLPLPDGRIVQGGGLGGNYLAVTGLRSTGRRDSRFGRRGTSLNGRYDPYLLVGALDGVQAMALAPDGKILLGGNVGQGFGVARLVSDYCRFDTTTRALTCP